MKNIDTLNLNDIRSVYFIGIGGIGMSALARFFNQNGKQVHGYDKVATPLTKKLVEEGLKIHFEDNPDLIPMDIDLVIYTPAIPDDHLEKKWLLQQGFKLYKRAEILGLISRSYKTIAVAGTHGKTTTSTLTTHILRKSGIDCTAFLGGISNDINGNYVLGESDWLVVEADEFDRSFLHLNPSISVVLSMDADHLDIYGAHNELKSTFNEFVNQTDSEGILIRRNDLELEFDQERTISFGEKGAEARYENVRVLDGSFVFDYVFEEVRIENIRLAIAGRHNIENACAALTVGILLNANPQKMKQALGEFKGIYRRFEAIYQNDSVVYIDDYAHHPTELKAAISAARELYEGKKVAGIFQPHLFSRTRDFMDEFAAALKMLDEVILLDIYPAREKPIEGITSQALLDKIDIENKKLFSKDELLDFMKIWNGEVLMSLGAGDIDQLVVPIKNILKENK